MFVVGSPFFYLTVLAVIVFIILLKKYKSVAFKVVFVNIIIILSLISIFDTLATMLFVKADKFRVSDNFYHHGLKPMVNARTNWKSDIYSQYQIYTNSLGLVDSSTRIVPLKKKGKRVLFMGDSFTEGVGYSWDKTMAGILSEKFKKQDTEVINGAVISYSPKLHYLKTKFLIDKGLEFDELFVFVDISDIIDEFVYNYFIPKKMTETEKVLEPLIDFFTKGSFIYRNYRLKFILDQKNPDNEHSDYWGGIKDFYKLKPKWTYNQRAFELYGQKGQELAKKHMDQLYKLCKKHNIRMHITVWPWEIHITEQDGSKQLELWRDFCKERGIHFMELFSLFETVPKDQVKSYFIPQDIHWSEKGNRFVAEHLWKLININGGQNESSSEN